MERNKRIEGALAPQSGLCSRNSLEPRREQAQRD